MKTQEGKDFIQTGREKILAIAEIDDYNRPNTGKGGEVPDMERKEGKPPASGTEKVLIAVIAGLAALIVLAWMLLGKLLFSELVPEENLPTPTPALNTLATPEDGWFSGPAGARTAISSLKFWAKWTRWQKRWACGWCLLTG